MPLGCIGLPLRRACAPPLPQGMAERPVNAVLSVVQVALGAPRGVAAGCCWLALLLVLPTEKLYV